ncbi:MAG: hypothetical protein WAT72_04675 [Microgenomates group bacterium]|jgi:hypothetical protein|nr:hypothetical protein [Candidatus Woesebacteria bacterium]MBP6883452.1 hypothetical protein [Candidatus Woesebacteria bacterium]
MPDLERGPSRPPIKSIVVGNDREFFSPVDRFVPESQRLEFVESDIDEADMDFMWFGDDKIVLLPRALDPEFISDISTLFGFKNARLLVPHETDAGLSSDIVSDEGVFQELVNEIDRAEDVQVVPFGYTPQFQGLVDNLRSRGANFRTPESPTDEGIAAAEYFETKVGSRDLLQRVKAKHPELDIKIPEGYVCDTVDDALSRADYFIESGRGVVFKANSGGAGIGVNVFKQEQVDTPEKLEEMRGKIRANGLFHNDKVVVEERIDVDFNHHGAHPSVDAIVTVDGTVEVQAIDAMVIRHDGEEVGFYGCVAGKGLFDETQADTLRKFTSAVGEELSAEGYRGWYDTDYILATDGQISPTEANLRRTSMSYVVDLAKLLYGDNWEEEVSIRTNDKFIRQNLHGISYAQLKEALSDIIYPMEAEKAGVVFTESMRSKFGRGKFGYAILGDGQERTREIELLLEVKVNALQSDQ